MPRRGGGRARSKGLYARRVVQVLEFFDDCRQGATVKEITAHCGWPQSSTSDLLAALVACGILYRDEESGRFQPTPRAAMLGTGAQPRLLNDGRLLGVIERLRAATSLSVAVMGRVGLDTQVFGWTAGGRGACKGRGVSTGMKTPLHTSAAGWLLLSTLGREQAGRVLRRLRAEAPAEQVFNLPAIEARVETCARQRYAFGPAGFGASGDFCGVLVPGAPVDQPLVLGLLFDKAKISPRTLVELLQSAFDDPGPAKAPEPVKAPPAPTRPPARPLVASIAYGR